MATNGYKTITKINGAAVPCGVDKALEGSVFAMPRDRSKQYQKMIEREKSARREKALDSENAYGNSDPTPREAVGEIIKEQKQGVA